MTRYDFCQWSNDDAGMQEDSDGEYIKYDEYKTLLEENARLQTALRQAINKRDMAQRELKRLKLCVWSGK
ncbi:hypothetical protein IF157_21345 [Salmonella enterica subsp. enterica serovar Typhimurium]|uniref:Uncharacterized protein n=3 Tax=root TaxID=1 RepID=A0A8E7FXK0_9CAUD|nr:hypothetical protein [Salmonella enterica]YP_010582382.1 hypothetical protein PF622_gp09 [Salmonella phage vB_STM-ZS]WOZ15077.1 hypothetical protein [Salmonella phage STP-1]EAN1947222.1 hypothetical protein [Salmonella enterica]EHQ2949255.1 hypothetical protein [Salmonella enterica]MBU4712457.1 hypothetical protein [Salmonella enterica subsp. enterica serovar Typhimurium]MBU4813812.1 hypothetical protein [Salmonella enterica subsp. enterica serovar Typhimurium]